MNIKLVCFDFDGVFTNGDIVVDNNILNKKYNIKDGMSLSILKSNNILTGLITSFKNKNYMINNENYLTIFNHLNFDFIKIGINNKLNALNDLLKELNLNYSNVAYIGDDINDIDILNKVAFSACPHDAVQECKDIVNYICKNNGGEGCVREFVDKIINLKFNKYYDILLEIKKEANYQLNNFNIENIEEIVDIIKNNLIQTIHFSGVGKSENIAIHASNLLKSIGLNAYYLNCLNSIHGDIGTIKNNDIIFLFSKSGNTVEILNILPALRLHNPYIISVTCNEDNLISKLCDKNIVIPFNNELSGKINTIPTNSYMSMLFFINILTMILVKELNITYNIYKLNHPGGNIGTKLLTIKDLLITNFPKIIFINNIKLSKILLEMTQYSIGCCFFINDKNELIGILTDGDIRRLMCENNKLEEINMHNINKNFYYEQNVNKMICDITDIKKYKFIPILKNKEIIGIIKS